MSSLVGKWEYTQVDPDGSYTYEVEIKESGSLSTNIFSDWKRLSGWCNIEGDKLHFEGYGGRVNHHHRHYEDIIRHYPDGYVSNITNEKKHGKGTFVYTLDEKATFAYTLNEGKLQLRLIGGNLVTLSELNLSKVQTLKSERGSGSLEGGCIDCYIATCVYGTYDSPELWTLRRFRDDILEKNPLGRLFVKLYYATGPKLVKAFGSQKWFHCLCRPILDKTVQALCKKGIDSSPYKY